MDDRAVWVNAELSIPLSELRLRFSRSSGPGGQNVNRTATRVELLFDVAHSPSLDDTQRALLVDRLCNLIDSEGVLHLTSQVFASQLRNREDVLARFAALLRSSLHVPARRHPTRPTAAARERRLGAKRRRAATKRGRGRVGGDEDS